MIGARTIRHPGTTVSRSSFYAPPRPGDHIDGSSIQPRQQGLVHWRAILQQATPCDYFSQGNTMISSHISCDPRPGVIQSAKMYTAIPGQCDPQVKQPPMIDLARIVYVCHVDGPSPNARLRATTIHRAITPGQRSFRHHIQFTWTEDIRK